MARARSLYRLAIQTRNERHPGQLAFQRNREWMRASYVESASAVHGGGTRRS